MSNHYTFTSTTPEGKKSEVYEIKNGRPFLTRARNFSDAFVIGERLAGEQPANEIRVVKNATVVRTFGPVENNGDQE